VEDHSSVPILPCYHTLRFLPVEMFEQFFFSEILWMALQPFMEGCGERHIDPYMGTTGLSALCYQGH